MTAPVVVDAISKRYTLGSGGGYRRLTEVLTNRVRRSGRPASPCEELWALKDVSFEVAEGEVVGLIGRNGAGKSTLLKILSRITEPTSGRAVLRGRVGSLLEVGTGFHPELTGRENIFLNGAVLGMRKPEIVRRFDEIAAFAEIDRFLDTPVKRYSSGMYVRLAFAVAAHLEPEILVVDEVLAVGDSAFQKKCLGKMSDVSKSGRTVLFVSHNMSAVRDLCTMCLWIDHGAVREWGTTAQVVTRYLRSQEDEVVAGALTTFEDDPTLIFQLREAKLLSPDGMVTTQFDCDSSVTVELQCVARAAVRGMYGYLEVQRADGTTVLVSDSYDVRYNPLEAPAAGEHVVQVEIPPRSLAPGDYQVLVSFASSIVGNEPHLHFPGIVARFVLEDTSSSRGNARRGYFSTLLNWHVSSSPLDHLAVQ